MKLLRLLCKMQQNHCKFAFHYDLKRTNKLKTGGKKPRFLNAGIEFRFRTPCEFSCFKVDRQVRALKVKAKDKKKGQEDQEVEEVFRTRMSDPPLLSQDEFFRSLDLQSVLASQSGGKAFYRQALKERLRATSKANYYENHKKTDRKQSPQVSPCKWLTESDRKRMFGRPRVRVELNLDSPSKLASNEDNSKEENVTDQPSLLRPLIDNCHVLR